MSASTVGNNCADVQCACPLDKGHAIKLDDGSEMQVHVHIKGSSTNEIQSAKNKVVELLRDFSSEIGSWVSRTIEHATNSGGGLKDLSISLIEYSDKDSTLAFTINGKTVMAVKLQNRNESKAKAAAKAAAHDVLLGTAHLRCRSNGLAGNRTFTVGTKALTGTKCDKAARETKLKVKFENLVDDVQKYMKDGQFKDLSDTEFLQARHAIHQLTALRDEASDLPNAAPYVGAINDLVHKFVFAKSNALDVRTEGEVLANKLMAISSKLQKFMGKEADSRKLSDQDFLEIRPLMQQLVNLRKQISETGGSTEQKQAIDHLLNYLFDRGVVPQ